jgi:hypothetical protein
VLSKILTQVGEECTVRSVRISAARMREKGKTYTFMVGNERGRNHLGDLGVDGRIILKSKWMVIRGLASFGSE